MATTTKAEAPTEAPEAAAVEAAAEEVAAIRLRVLWPAVSVTAAADATEPTIYRRGEVLPAYVANTHGETLLRAGAVVALEG